MITTDPDTPAWKNTADTRAQRRAHWGNSWGGNNEHDTSVPGHKGQGAYSKGKRWT